ncbi:MAG TPA: YccF domain-containing protein [Actinomycetes bacterium]|jgi:uncharacterized membrane protein YccF (DUF307 family)|nr:YccF domain-containing protein [Actinomycetes bacterium]
MLRFVGNVIWLLLAGLPLAIGYAVFRLLAFVLMIITIPFGKDIVDSDDPIAAQSGVHSVAPVGR